MICFIVLSAVAVKLNHVLDLQAANVRHHKVGEIDEPAMYRIDDDLVMLLLIKIHLLPCLKKYWLSFSYGLICWQEYSVEIHEWSGKSWEPYISNDVQIQFYMMSPYVLKTLSSDQKVLSFSMNMCM